MEKGKKASVSMNKETIDLENITDENFLSWKTRILKFRETPFIEVAKKLSDFYGISFTVTDSALKNEPFSTTIINQSADDIVKILQMANDNIEVIKTESGYNIGKKK
ncbi:MAG: DUF4974 domain-containing protein [Bacteroidales bacterium]|nr:DUF4974 domain-containing protein [Bacteroidales bacterium]